MEIDNLPPCPFCGGEAYEKYVGNQYAGWGKSEIGCTKCHFKRVQRFIRMKYNFEWIQQVTREAWGRHAYESRPVPPPLPCETCEIPGLKSVHNTDLICRKCREAYELGQKGAR